MSTTGSTSKTRRTPISPVTEGDVVDGKYRVERTLAAGGMGVIVAARHLVLDQPVALKFLIPHVEDDQLVARFLREARSAARVQSNHVVRVFDCGTLPSGVPFMAMELLEGKELGQELKARGPLPVEEAVDTVLAALEGLAAAHALGIVHRDLKPSNLFLASHGRSRTVKVLDFGISKPLAGPDTPIDDELTGTAVMLGSPRYASPEQAQSSRSVDVRTDIWSMGVVLYELLDGKCPFGGASMGEILGKVLLYKPPPLSAKRPDVPGGLDEVLSRCIVRDLDLRFPDVAALAAALVPFASVQGRLHAERVAAILGTSLHAKETENEAAAVAPPPPRPPSPSDVALTVVEPAPTRAPSLDAAPPAPRSADPAPGAASVGDATVGTFARSERAPGSRLGWAAIAAALGTATAVAIFLFAPREPATGGGSPSTGPALDATPQVEPAATSTPVGTATLASAAPSASASGAPAPSASAPQALASSSPRAPAAPPRPAGRPPTAPKGGVLDRSD